MLLSKVHGRIYFSEYEQSPIPTNKSSTTEPSIVADKYESNNDDVTAATSTAVKAIEAFFISWFFLFNSIIICNAINNCYHAQAAADPTRQIKHKILNGNNSTHFIKNRK